MANEGLIFRSVGSKAVTRRYVTPRKPVPTAVKRHRDKMPGYRASLDFTVKDREVRRTF